MPSQAASSGAREAPFAVDPALLSPKFSALAAATVRIEALMDEVAETIDAQRVRQVTVTWTGFAQVKTVNPSENSARKGFLVSSFTCSCKVSALQEVRLHGSFDNWSKGVPLSPDGDSTSGPTQFSVSVNLVPGEHAVKLLCDGQWQSIEGLEHRGLNNVLKVI